VRQLLSPVPRNHRESRSAQRRRKAVVVVTEVAGSALLRRSLRRKPGSKEFYADALGVATLWGAGGLAAGKLHLGHELAGEELRRPFLTPVVTGAAAFGALYGCALVARRLPVLREAVTDVLAFEERGDSRAVLVTTLANGVAEEVFFRGALYAASRHHPVAVSTAAYTATTAVTRNPALTLAAAGMGTLFGLQRRTSGGIQASTITHVVWSALVLRFLPPLFRRPALVE
jgi:hypothetical protein